jgi:hypothetical protein
VPYMGPTLKRFEHCMCRNSAYAGRRLHNSPHALLLVERCPRVVMLAGQATATGMEGCRAPFVVGRKIAPALHRHRQACMGIYIKSQYEPGSCTTAQILSATCQVAVCVCVHASWSQKGWVWVF